MSPRNDRTRAQHEGRLSRYRARRAVRRAAHRVPGPVGTLRAEPVPVTGAGGVPLHVEVEEHPDPSAPTIVFAHGVTVTLDTWHYQRAELRDLGRAVYYDHRGHGRSGPTEPGDATMARLAEDLRTVIEATAPPGSPVVVAGHSMGGITIMALATHHPELFGDRIVGVALCDTSACLAESVFHLPPRLAQAGAPYLGRLMAVLLRNPGRLDAARRLTALLTAPLVGRMAFADPRRDPALVRSVYQMVAACPSRTLAAFLADLADYDLRETLHPLSEVETLVLAGRHDRLIPLAHKRVIADRVPDARLEVVRGAGHMAIMERPDVVNPLLRDLVTRAVTRRANGTRTA
ncbi:alpha/beta fold hydrolase [Actinomadura hibisca]|uniref:alpha/beta fold hydrolase n=1 Tax=Actinomadura hibisca TaxID=68565 RepID=UPI00082E110C|nr:alpha/beta hydrolase [Actinomadura hibisca]